MAAHVMVRLVIGIVLALVTIAAVLIAVGSGCECPDCQRRRGMEQE